MDTSSGDLAEGQQPALYGSEEGASPEEHLQQEEDHQQGGPVPEELASPETVAYVPNPLVGQQYAPETPGGGLTPGGGSGRAPDGRTARGTRKYSRKSIHRRLGR